MMMGETWRLPLANLQEATQSQMTIYDLIKERVARNPGAAAILAPNRLSLTYRGLCTQVEHAVGTLRSLGVGPSDRVAMVLPNGPETAVAFLAVSSAATSAPLNPAYGTEEFEFYLSDLRPKALLVGASMDSPARAVAQALGIAVLELSPIMEAEAGVFRIEGHGRQNKPVSGTVRPDDVALMLYTSGTTSRPKLVPLTHTNLGTSAIHMRKTYELGEDDRCLNVMPLFHIHGLSVALLAPLVAGGSVVCVPGFDAARFFDWVDDFGPTWYTAVPTMHLAILSEARANRKVIARCPLRFILSRSAALPDSVRADLERLFGVPALEAYGLTEASPHVAGHRLPPYRRRHGSAGKAAGPEMAIMDEDGNLLPAGMTGEIVVRGANVFRGYEDNPKANRSSFVNGWLRTGDQGRLDRDGYLFVTGRLKEIISRGGEKVAPQEVDDVLLEHPSVLQAATFAVPHPTLGEDIAAAVVLREDTFASEKQLREWAFARLADHKIPSQVLIVGRMPTSSIGKVQRRLVAEAFGKRLTPAFLAASSPLETRLATLWSEVLVLDGEVGVHDNFFALGGDSLSATRLVSRVRDAFSVELPLTSVFREPVLADQALTIEENILSRLESLTEEEARHAKQAY